jgi:hypothetical protein
MEKYRTQRIIDMRLRLTLGLAVIFALSACNQSAEQKAAPVKEASAWITLFDGSSMEGWRAYNGESLPPGWAIVDSVMTFSTEMILEQDYDYKGSRDIIYGAKEFENFELYVEWKIPPGGNSGIFYHIAEGYAGIPEVAPEYQLIDDLGYTDFHDITDYNKSIGIEDNPQDLQPLQSTAADYAMHIPDASKKQLNPAGEWNSSTIVFTPEKVEHYLNGVLLLDFVPWSEEWQAKRNDGKWKLAPDYGKFKKGFIGFQDHGSSLWFRNVKIKEL